MHCSIHQKTAAVNWEIPETGQRIVADEPFVMEHFPTAVPCKEQFKTPEVDKNTWEQFELLLKQSLYGLLSMGVKSDK